MPSKVTRPSTAVKRAHRATKPSSFKKRKLSYGKAAPLGGSKGKQRAYEKATIPLPDIPGDGDDETLSDQDIQFFTANLETGDFLDKLDRTEISRSKRETARLHNLSKPPRVHSSYTNDLVSVDSQDEDDENWSDSMEGSDPRLNGDDSGSDLDDLTLPVHQEVDSDQEQPYEREPHKRGTSWNHTESGTVSRLPIKLPDGKVVKTKARVIPPVEDDTEEDEFASSNPQESQVPVVEDVSTGARFGRLAVANVVGISSRQMRIQTAKEQIAGICQDILADPESSLGLLRRLHTFSLPEIGVLQSQSTVANDPLIRRLAMVSQLAIFKDVIPGYRIRKLTETEKAEKVSQMVAKTREWEQGLVSIYQTYLGTLDSELKGRTEFADLALKSMCTLLNEVTHFNFRTNLIGAIVMRLSKRSWDNSSEMCLQTFVNVFKSDATGVPSLEIVRMLNRMVKERKFNVHPNALSCLLHLRLKSELGGVRASENEVEQAGSTNTRWEGRYKADRKRAKGKKVERPHMSKKAIKAFKEKKEIEAQMREAEAEVDQEERANMQTETLKLLFVLYFSIIKASRWTPLVPVALRGLSRYAHMINIDFFKDLMQVLKTLMSREDEESEEFHHADSTGSHLTDQIIRHKLLLIVTAFELLSGQGEALNIDLQDFVDHLYALIPPLSLQPDIESLQQKGADGVMHTSTADLLFRALTLAFPTRSSTKSSPVRQAAFVKRILVACLFFSPATAVRSLEFVGNLLLKEPKLHAMLSTQDRTADGVYRPDLDDPQLSNPFAASLWELQHLAAMHWDNRVRDRARSMVRLDST